MERIPLVTSSTIIPVENFWSSVWVYHDRPNVVNRKLAAVSQVLFCKISFPSPIKRISDIFTKEALLYQIRKTPDLAKITPDFIRNITYEEAVVEKTERKVVEESATGVFISVHILFGRKNAKCAEFVIFDKNENCATFFAIQENSCVAIAPKFSYHFELSQTGNLRIILNSFEDAETASAEWLADKLFPKLLKWAEHDTNQDTIKSLTLVAPDEYCALYTHLKSKYGESLVKKWPQKTKTDPQKYVFEDLAIATYLICLWRKLDSQQINFVDCGCGNGLLVYVLNQEGYKGCGFDIRRRKTWDLYENQADLRVGTISPESLFPEATWLIGNHSDELTPWIPIIALNSSVRTNFFLLPCCPYDLNGQKYVRKNTAVSQYGEYLDYIKRVCVKCGFATSVDKLRIPSTRRTCLVGVRQSFKIDEIREDVATFVEERVGCGFTPRNVVEQVRNCTQLDKGLVEKITTMVVRELLDSQNLLMVKFDGKTWNQGGTKHLSELSQKISPEDRQFLKKEYGGLQTLLKNRRYIFDVRNGGVSLQKPLSLEETAKYKDKPCWFLGNHPDGCFLQAGTCAYKHVEKL